MSILYVAIVCLAIAVSVGVVIGYLAGHYRGFEHGWNQAVDYSLLHTVAIMDSNGMFVSWCEALKNTARREGMTDTEIIELMKEQEQALKEVRINK